MAPGRASSGGNQQPDTPHVRAFINLNVQELLWLQYSRLYTLQPTAATDQTFLGSDFHLLYTCMYIKANAGIYRLTGHKLVTR
jgi:hypothetical protein